VLERINRIDTPAEPAARPSEDARDGLRQRLDRLGDGHPSSDHYRDAAVSRRDGSADTARTDTNREDATGTDTDREETTGTRTDSSRDLSQRAGLGWDSADARDRPAENDIQLPTDRDRHILDGDGEGKPGGGHRYGTGKPGKTEFPERWQDEVILAVVEEVARTPDSVERQRDGSWHATGEYDGVRLTAAVLADGRIWTAWPHPGGVGVRQNPTEGPG
jgi:hypothetical protein